MTRKGFIIILSLLCSCLPVSAENAPELPEKPKHVIFLIHGIGGDKTHFGYMAQALPGVLSQKDPSTEYTVKNIEYDTGNNKKTPYDFAQDINVVIEETAARFNDHDKFSLIMHSQGGLVGSIWMFQSLMGTPGYSSPAIIEHLDAFITLGTPFWGAKTAEWGSEIKSLTNSLGVEVPLPFGKKELEQMSFGSDTIVSFRMVMISPAYKPYIDYLKTHVRFLNIVGVADLLNPLGIFVSGRELYEDDGAVPLASARFNFLYSQSVGGDYEEGSRVGLEHVREIDMAPYVIVNAMHRSPLPELDNFAGIAQIPRKCTEDTQCGHPAFPYLWRHLLGRKVRQLDDTLGDFKTFLLDLNVRVNSPGLYSCGNIGISLTKPDGSSLKNSNIELQKFYELYSEGHRTSQKYPNQCRFYFTGSLKKVLPDRNETVLITLSGPGLKTRSVEMRLKESYSSFVDVQLNP